MSTAVIAIAFAAGICYAVVAISAQTQLQEELPEDVRDAYIYLNNDAEGHAVANANTMIFLLTPFAVNHAEEKAPEATGTPSPAPPATE